MGYDDVISYCGTSSHYHNYYNYHNNNNRDNFNHHRDNFNYHRDNFNHHSTRNYHRKYSISWGHQKCMEFGRGTFFYEFYSNVYLFAYMIQNLLTILLILQCTYYFIIISINNELSYFLWISFCSNQKLLPKCCYDYYCEIKFYE